MPRPKPGIRPGAWAVAYLALVFAVLSVGSALDRRAIFTPAAEGRVPGPARGYADIASSRAALLDGNVAEATAAASRVITAMPVAAEGPSILAAAMVLSNEAEAADAAYRVAAAGGWRDVLTQGYWARQSALAGEWDLSAARIDAILRARPDLPTASILLAPLEQSAEGRAALLPLMAQRPNWLARYLTPDGSVDAEILRRRAPLITALAQEAGPLGCARATSATRALLQAGEVTVADTLWRAHCPGAEGIVGLADGEFARADMDGTDPFGWRFVPSGDVRLSLSGAGEARTLEVTNRAASAKLVASQIVQIGQGPVRVRWSARESGAVSERVGISIDCNRPSRPSFDDGASRVIDVRACDTQTLSVWVDRGSQPVIIDGIFVED